MLSTPAGYYLSFGEVKPGEEYARSRSAFSPCILTDEKEMLAFWGRKVYRMEKVVDYDDIVEGKDFFKSRLWALERGMGGYGSSKIRATRRRRIYRNELFHNGG